MDERIITDLRQYLVSKGARRIDTMNIDGKTEMNCELPRKWEEYLRYVLGVAHEIQYTFDTHGEGRETRTVFYVYIRDESHILTPARYFEGRTMTTIDETGTITLRLSQIPDEQP